MVPRGALPAQKAGAIRENRGIIAISPRCLRRLRALFLPCAGCSASSCSMAPKGAPHFLNGSAACAFTHNPSIARPYAIPLRICFGYCRFIKANRTHIAPSAPKCLFPNLYLRSACASIINVSLPFQSPINRLVHFRRNAFRQGYRIRRQMSFPYLDSPFAIGTAPSRLSRLNNSILSKAGPFGLNTFARLRMAGGFAPLSQDQLKSI